ncbi:hypothetical protein NMD15_15510 (plasmid) [Plesiomonas shigelloides]|uniref:hypothetical protein n=1 Tax=Plesiomonas shigelloides TaxID=703 RepID=UPI00351CDB56
MKPMMYTLNNWQVVTLTGELDALFVSEHRDVFETLAVRESSVLRDPLIISPKRNHV